MKYLASLFILISLAACQMGKFDRYPGTVQKSFPENMRGTYYFVIPPKFKSATSGIKEGDTVMYVITENTISMIDTAGKRTQQKLDKEQVLTLVEGKHYVVSSKDKTYKKYWNCMVYESDKNSLSIYPAIDETRKSELNKYFDRTFIGLNESKDSVYSYTMNEKSFVEYFRKELKGDPIKLKRLK